MSRKEDFVEDALPHFSTPEREQFFEDFFPRLTFARATRAHVDHPERNEDFALADPGTRLAVVCDGVGTVEGAGQAARIAARKVRAHWARMLTSLPPLHLLNGQAIETSAIDTLLKEILEEANKAVLVEVARLTRRAIRAQKKQADEEKDAHPSSENGQQGEAKDGPPSSSNGAHQQHANAEKQERGKKIWYAQTTIALALVLPQKDGYLMGYAHVGDSRVYLLRKGESIQRLTEDDGYFTWKVNKGELEAQNVLHIEQATQGEQLSEEEREHFDHRNGISQALGHETLALHTGQVPLHAGDRVLLCTDGIHDNLTDAELEEMLRQGARTTVARKLLARTVERSEQDTAACLRAKKDDMTLIVITCNR